jgi:hypothetical protein
MVSAKSLGLVLFSYWKRKVPRGYERKCQKHLYRAVNNKPKLNTLSFEGQKKQKPIFSTKAAGSYPPHTKAKSARAAFYGRVKQCPLAEALEALFNSCWGKKHNA